MMSNSLERIIYFAKKRHENATFFSPTKETISKLNFKTLIIGSAGVSSYASSCLKKICIASVEPKKIHITISFSGGLGKNRQRKSISETIKKLHRRYVEIHAHRYMHIDYFNLYETVNRLDLYKFEYSKSNIIEKIKKEAKTTEISTYIWLLFWLYIYSKKRVRIRKWACFPAPLNAL